MPDDNALTPRDDQTPVHRSDTTPAEGSGQFDLLYMKDVPMVDGQFGDENALMGRMQALMQPGNAGRHPGELLVQAMRDLMVDPQDADQIGIVATSRSPIQSRVPIFFGLDLRKTQGTAIVSEATNLFDNLGMAAQMTGPNSLGDLLALTKDLYSAAALHIETTQPKRSANLGTYQTIAHAFEEASKAAAGGIGEARKALESNLPTQAQLLEGKRQQPKLTDDGLPGRLG